MKEDWIIRYFNNSCSSDESAQIESWLSQSEEHRAYFNKLKKIWEASVEVPHSITPNYNKAWNRINRKTKLNTPVRTISPQLRLFKFAASILVIIALGVGLFHFYNKPVIISIANTSIHKRTVLLDDGTAVSLNTNASITFPKKFKGYQREVTMHGEAFFKVARNEKHPFVVFANGTQIKVLGTSFNIKITGTEKVEVSVITGKVSFQPADNPDKVLQLTKGETGTYNNTKLEISKTLSDDENLLAWETGILTFNNRKLSDVALTLSKYYSKPVFVDPTLQSRQISVTFNNLSLEEVLDILEITLDIHIAQTPGTVYLKP